MGEAAKPLLFEGFQAGCHVVLRGRRGTLSHANLFDNVSKVSKLEEVSHEMLVLLRPRVSSPVSGFPVASPCLWGKLQNLSFSKVSKQVVMSVCSTKWYWEVVCASFVVQKLYWEGLCASFVVQRYSSTK